LGETRIDEAQRGVLSSEKRVIMRRREVSILWDNQGDHEAQRGVLSSLRNEECCAEWCPFFGIFPSETCPEQC